MLPAIPVLRASKDEDAAGLDSAHAHAVYEIHVVCLAYRGAGPGAAERKDRLFDDRALGIALQRLYARAARRGPGLRDVMSGCTEVEWPFLEQLASQGWTVIDQGPGVPQDAAVSLHGSFRQWLRPEMFDAAVRAINRSDDGREWLTDRQLEELTAHAGHNGKVKASEMEHAIRKHCTVHHDEDPAFCKRLSEQVDALIEKHQDEWDLLAEKLAELRAEAIAGRQNGENGLTGAIGTSMSTQP